MTSQPQKAVLFVMRYADMWRVHPQMDTSHVCCRCGEKVGIYPSGQRVLRSHGEGNVQIVCTRCEHGVGRLAPGAEIEPFQSHRKQ